LNLVLSYGDLSRAGGYRTRVLGELEALDRQGIPPEGEAPLLMVFDRRPAELEKSLPAGIRHLTFPRSAPLDFFSAVSNLAKQKPIGLVHAHNLYSAALALSRRRRYRYRVVLDYHGRIPEEYAFLGKGGRPSRMALEALERWCVKKSDHVVVVSDKLGRYVMERYRVPADKVSTIPCCADETIFRWDAARREAVRRSRNLGDKFVCTHLGSFFEWYQPESVIDAFQEIRNRADAHLLVITPNVEKAGSYLGSRLPVESFSVFQVAHHEVPGLLNASDLGLLLLRRSPNIETSSPAKFAEYLCSGLPVLISESVGDFSELVTRHTVGAVADENARFDVSLLDDILRNRSAIAGRCTAAGASLTWQAARPIWTRIVRRLSP
jgi:glycosyltransferase involved in cell wall biosynthesis